MNLDELQSIRDRERQSDSLQQLREDFYVDVGEFVQELREERDAVAERADDPFDAPEVNRLTDDINTAEQTVEAIYERRVGKLVKMASFAAADMPTEDEGLTAEERQLFERMVAAIEDNRDTVMHVIDGADPTDVSPNERPAASPPEPGADQPPEPQPTEDRPAASAGDAEREDSGVDAADLMAGSDASPEPPDRDPTPTSDNADGAAPAGQEPAGETPPGTEADAPAAEGAPPDASEPIPPDVREDGGGVSAAESRGEAGSQPDPAADPASEETPDGQPADGRGATASERSAEGTDRVDRETVRITADVGQIFGVDEREYELTQEDVVTLPAENAAPLVERDVAERLDRTGN